jgi:hypothetical protein
MNKDSVYELGRRHEIHTGTVPRLDIHLQPHLTFSSTGEILVREGPVPGLQDLATELLVQPEKCLDNEKKKKKL